MKSSEEMVKDLFERRDRYFEEKNSKKRKRLKYGLAFGSMLAIVVIGIGVWKMNSSDLDSTENDSIKTIADNKAVSDKENNQTIENDSNTNFPKTGNDKNEDIKNDYKSEDIRKDVEIPDKSKVLWANSFSDDIIMGNPARTDGNIYVGNEGLHDWNGKCVGSNLWSALEAGDEDDIYAIAAWPAVDMNFVYEGKTFSQYELEADYEGKLPERMAVLMKIGDELKYGTALYETGTPDGLRYDRKLYEDILAEFENFAEYYSALNLLDKYIVDGKFLKEQLEKDYELACNCTDAHDAAVKAKVAYLNEVKATLSKDFAVEVVNEGESFMSSAHLRLYLTKEEFKRFPYNGISDDWGYFGFDGQNVGSLSGDE